MRRSKGGAGELAYLLQGMQSVMQHGGIRSRLLRCSLDDINLNKVNPSLEQEQEQEQEEEEEEEAYQALDLHFHDGSKSVSLLLVHGAVVLENTNLVLLPSKIKE